MFPEKHWWTQKGFSKINNIGLVHKAFSKNWYWVRVQSSIRRVWRYQRVNQIPYIEEEQTIQWPKEKVQKNKQRSTKPIHKNKDRVTRTPLNCSGRVGSSCSFSDTRRVNLVRHPLISLERGNDREVFTISGTICFGHLWHRYSITVNHNYVLPLIIMLC